MYPRKILCPVDFSTGSDHALRVASRLAIAANAELVITYAWYIPELAYMAGSWMLPPDVVQQIIEDGEQGLAAAVASASRLGVSRVTSVLQGGHPGDEIVRMLEVDTAFDLVVMGTHGRSGLMRVLLGSVAEYVARHAPCSVLATREAVDNAPFRSVLCPVDFSPGSRTAVQVAVELAAPGGSGLTILNVIDEPIGYRKLPPLSDLLGEVDRRTTARLDAWVEELRPKISIPVVSFSRLGRPGAQILEQLDAASYDLVVLGGHGHTGIRRALLGSVAEKVLRHAPCPVLVARTR